MLQYSNILPVNEPITALAAYLWFRLGNFGEGGGIGARNDDDGRAIGCGSRGSGGVGTVVGKGNLGGQGCINGNIGDGGGDDAGDCCTIGATTMGSKLHGTS